MADYKIPLSYVVNATLLGSSRGLEPLQLGTILLLTDDEPVAPNVVNDYIISRTASNITNNFGTETITAKLANAIFAQNPNILGADGYVIVAPYLTDTVITPATAGTLTTIDLSDNLTGLEAVTNGSLTLTVDGGNAQAATSINLSGATSLSDIAAILSAEFTGVAITVNENSNSLVFTSETTGATSSVAMTTSATGTDLYGSSYLDGSSATATIGTDAVYENETTQAAIQRLAQNIYFEGVISCRDLDDEEAIAASNQVETMANTVFFLTDISTSTFEQGGLFNILQNNSHTRKLLFLTGQDDTEKKTNAKVFAAAFASRGLSVNYAAENSTLTMTYKDLAGVVVDTNISETVLNQCETYGADVYCSIEGLPKVISFRQGGLYFDQLANRIWLRTSVQLAAANVLFTTRTKIPQTTAGVTSLINAVSGVLNQGVINGMLAPGEWNSPDTFGVLDDFHRDIRTFGYYTYFTPIADQTQAEREQRKCPVISIAAKEAGAIEHADIIIYVEA